ARTWSIHPCLKIIQRLRSGVESVFENKSCDSLLCQCFCYLPALVAHRKPHKTSSGCHDDGCAICLTRFGEERGERGSGDVSGDLVARLAKPGLGSRLIIVAARTEWNSIGRRTRFERVACSVLSHSPRCTYKECGRKDHVNEVYTPI